VEMSKGDGSSIKYNDYDIKYDQYKGLITNVVNRRFGPVKYIATRIDKECGYVVGSKALIYTTEHSSKDNMLNLIHVHINDTSD
jgi:hypothetical protein